MNKDYGFYLLEQGFTNVTSMSFYDVPIDHLAVIAPQVISTMLTKEEEGTAYAMSFDFPENSHQSLFDCLPQDFVKALQGAMGENFEQAVVYDFSQPLPLNITANLGEPQVAEKETFVPLVVQQVALLG